MSRKMPFCSQAADSLRAVFGADGINAKIKSGDFYARENGIELGTRAPEGVIPYVAPMVVIGKVRHGR